MAMRLLTPDRYVSSIHAVDLGSTRRRMSWTARVSFPP
jgi:hypothetical protein